MISGYIRLDEVLRDMDRIDSDGQGAAFDIKFVTLDLKRDTGGRIDELKGVRKCVGKKNGKVIYGREPSNGSFSGKDPDHWKNATRNLLLPNGQMRKIHIRLIIGFNGKKVCY